MLFQVFGKDGFCKMYTEYEDCIPYEYLDSMAKSGHVFKLNGKTISKSQLFANAPAKATAKPTMKVVCVETGKAYDTQSQAARDLGIDPAQVSDSIKTGRKRSGYTFIKEER